MNIETYLKRHGTPPMDIFWGIRELARNTEAPEPAILIDCMTSLNGYPEFIAETIGQSTEISLAWNTFRQGWTIDPVLNGNILSPPIVVYYYPEHGWVAAVERKKAREINTLWKCRCPFLVRFRVKPVGRWDPGYTILFDSETIYDLDEIHAQLIMEKLDYPEYPFDTLQFWATAGSDS